LRKLINLAGLICCCRGDVDGESDCGEVGGEMSSSAVDTDEHDSESSNSVDVVSIVGGGGGGASGNGVGEEDISANAVAAA